MKASRRTFFGLMGSAPIAAKAAADDAIAKASGVWSSNGIGDASHRLFGAAGTPIAEADLASIPYEKRLIGAADYIKTFGLPEVMEFELRDQARYVSALDPDIACKASWSMSVKIMTQRQRNYQRAVSRIEKSAWQQRGRQMLKKFLGFDWPY